VRDVPLLVTLALVVLAPSVLRAEDPPPSLRRADLGELAAPPVVRGPVLAAPSDLVHDERGATGWALFDVSTAQSPRQVWVEFPEPEGGGSPALAVPVDKLLERVRSTQPESTREAGIEAEPASLRLFGTAEQVAAITEVVAWTTQGMAPHVHLEATLSGGSEGAVLVHARVRLFAGRWTRLWLQEERTRYPCEWDIEIAQATTAVHPILRDLPEGQELYARWVPGESRSLVELWTGDLEHQDVVEVDLTPIRNVPEASGLGPARAPRTALRRGYTALSFRPGDGGKHELLWDGPEGARRLGLALEDESPRPAARTPGTAEPATEAAWLRVGAVGAGLLFESRPHTAEALLDELNWLAQRLPGGEYVDLDLMSQGTLAAISSTPSVRAALLRHLVEREGSMGDATLAVRTVTLPEESVRSALRDGSLAAGRPVPTAGAALLGGPGAVRGPSVTLPLVGGVKAGVRCGSSVPGLVWLDVEVAQEAGGMDPVFGVAFAGLAGEARLARTGDGRFAVDLDLTLSWADPKGGRADLTVRPPVWMTQVAGRNPVETEVPKRITLPTLSHAAAEVAGRVPAGKADEPETLLGVVVRGSEVSLVLARAVLR
jgi:hypothetical protein